MTDRTFNVNKTDNGNECRAKLFRDTIESLDVKHRFIRAGRSQSNGNVERVQGTIIQEIYRPTLINYVQPSITGLCADLDIYLTYYNDTRKHRGRLNNGATPASIITTARRDIIRILDTGPTAPDVLAAYNNIATLT